MTNDNRITAAFEESRPRLQGIAYRMLGTHADAEDAVQEAWLRLNRADSDVIENLSGWLTTVVARVCLDHLRARRARTENMTKPRGLYELEVEAVDKGDPEKEMILADSLGAALLVVLDVLRPDERLAFVLHDVFAVPFDEIADILDRSPEAARQLASRARRRVQGTAPTTGLDLVRHRKIVDAFLHAARSGNFEALLSLLHPDVVLRPDASALKMGSLRETRGAEAVAKLLAGGAQAAQIAIVDGITALIWAPGGQTRGVIEFTLSGDRIAAIDVTGDVDRIGKLDIVPLAGQ